MRSRTRRRDTSDISNQRLPVSNNRSYVSPSLNNLGFSSLREFEDRRTWHPEGTRRPAASFSTPRHRLTVVDPLPRILGSYHSPIGIGAAYSGVNATIAFQRPRRVLLCVRRQQRREVLAAQRRIGKGSGGSRHDRWTNFSNVRCK